MGKHCAPRKPDFSVRLVMLSAAALLTTVVTADRLGSPGSGSTTRPFSDPFAVPPIAGPDMSPEPMTEEMHAAAPTARRADPVTPTSAEDPPPVPRDLLSAVAASWIAGTTQGYEWLTKAEQAMLADIMAVMDPHRPPKTADPR